MKVIYHIKHHIFSNVHIEVDFFKGNVYISFFLATVMDGCRVRTEKTYYNIGSYKRLTKKIKSNFENQCFLMQGKYMEYFLHYLNHHHATPLKRAESAVVW